MSSYFKQEKKKMYLVAIGRDKPEIPHLLILSPNDDKTRSEELHMGFPNRWQEPKHLGHLHRHISSELNWKWSIQYLNQCLCGMVCRCHIQPLHLLCYNTSPKLLLLLLFFFLPESYILENRAHCIIKTNYQQNIMFTLTQLFSLSTVLPVD